MLSANFIAGQSVPPARSLSGALPGLGITTGKADVNDSDPTAVNPGGVPIFKGGHEVGGIGVAGVPGDVAEYAAFTAVAANGFAPNPAPPGVVVINGVSLPFVNQTTAPSGRRAQEPSAVRFRHGADRPAQARRPMASSLRPPPGLSAG